MALKLPDFLTRDGVKKALVEIATLSVSGLICTVGSYGIVSHWMKKQSHAPATAAVDSSVESSTAAVERADTHAATEGEEKKAETKSHGEAPAKEEHKSKESESKGHGEKGKDGAGSSGGSDTHYALKPVIVNLSDPNARRYAKMTLTLDLTNEKIKSSIEEHEPEVYDALIKILGNYRFEEINTSTGKEALKEEIKGRLNQILKNGIAGAYLTEMIVQ